MFSPRFSPCCSIGCSWAFSLGCSLRPFCSSFVNLGYIKVETRFSQSSNSQFFKIVHLYGKKSIIDRILVIHNDDGKENDTKLVCGIIRKKDISTNSTDKIDQSTVSVSTRNGFKKNEKLVKSKY